MTSTIPQFLEELKLAAEKVRSKRLELASLANEREHWELDRTKLRYVVAERLQGTHGLSASAALEKARAEPDYLAAGRTIANRQMELDALAAEIELAQTRVEILKREIDYQMHDRFDTLEGP